MANYNIPIPGWALSEDAVMGVYAILANEKYLYIGKSVFIPKRIAEHMRNLTREPEKYFGILPKEIINDEVCISIKLLEVCICEKELYDREKYYIKDREPILQQNPNSDRCIPQKKRRSAVINALGLQVEAISRNN